MESEEVWGNIVKGAMKIPFVKVDRDAFLRGELQPYCNASQIETAINESPTKVLTKKQIDKIANGCISHHLKLVCAASAVAGLPGGWSVLATIPADVTQYYAHIFALVQKMLYIYGCPDLQDGNGRIDDETLGIITLFVGVMFGSDMAKKASSELSKSLAEQVAKRLPKKHLTKYLIYNVVKEVAKWLGKEITKDSFAKGASKVVPLIGAPISAAVTYFAFKPMANRLKKHLDEQLSLQGN